MTSRIEGHWWQPEGWLGATVALSASNSAAVSSVAIESITEAKVPLDAPYFIPSPVDLHCHGGGGADVMAGDEAIHTMLASHASHGCGALLATSVAAPFSDITDFLQSVKRVMKAPRDGEAQLLGAHLEGPFINPGKLGAQPPHAVTCNLTQLESWLDSGVVRVITFAPENNVADDVISLCHRFNVRVQLGHSLCDWATAKRCLDAGCGVTHLFNAMSGVSHRGGGLALAALTYGNYAEIIADGFHVDQASFDLALKSIPKLYSVTDATAAAGMPDGQYQLGSIDVEKSCGCVRLADGTLAGSCLTQLDAVTKLRQWDVSWHRIAELVSVRPSAWINEQSHGVIAPGKPAHWLEIQDDKPSAIWFYGRRELLTG